MITWGDEQGGRSAGTGEWVAADPDKIIYAGDYRIPGVNAYGV